MTASAVRIDVVDGAAARDAVTDELAALLGAITFGSAGLRYRRLDVADQLARLHDPVYVLARDGGALRGCCVLDRRALVVGGRDVPGVYRGSLGVAPTHARRGIGRALAGGAREWIDARARAAGEPVLSWGCIERDNHPSLALLRASGAHDAGGLAMPMRYRQWPRERLALEPLPPGRDPREAVLLAATQAGSAVRDVTPSRLPGFATSDARGLRVSARVALGGYAIETMGAMTDALVALFVTPFPFARRRFDVNRFRHVRLVDVALREGCERDWPAFVATLLARHEAHFALTFVDPRSALGRRLGAAGRRGVGGAGGVSRTGGVGGVSGMGGTNGTGDTGDTGDTGGSGGLGGAYGSSGTGGTSDTRRSASSASLRVMVRWSVPEGGGAEADRRPPGTPSLPEGPLALAPIDG